MSGIKNYLEKVSTHISDFAEKMAGGVIDNETAWAIGTEIAFEASDFPFLIGDHRHELGFLYNYMLLDLIARRVDRIGDISEEQKIFIKYICNQEKDCELYEIYRKLEEEKEN